MKQESRHLEHQLSTPVQFLKGIGPVRASALSKIGVDTLGDLFCYIPRRYLDKTAVVSISELRERSLRNSAAPGDDVTRLFTVLAEVRSFRVIGFRAKSRLVLVVGDSTGSIQCVWFGGVQYWKNRFSVGDKLAIAGQPTWYGRVLQFVHPDVERISEEGEGGDSADTVPSSLFTGSGFVPLYPSGKDLERVGLDSAGFRRVIGSALRVHHTSLPEILPASLRRARGLETLAEALQHVHFPSNNDELNRGLRRMKYEELFLFQLMLARRRQKLKEESSGISFSIKSALARRLVDSLPFALTKAQIRVIREITADMESTRPLNRLLQGDVGSGKTIVALIAMLIAVENGCQACFMAPTEILAEQHYRTITSFLGSISINVRLLVGGQKTRLRKDVLQDVHRGSAHIVVGTHALFEQSVQFSRLGLVVIDEQHRFGVMQRALLGQKGERPDVLVMTATPIPRTLSLTLYGDLDVSVIDELPKDRKPVKTLVKYENEKEWVYRFTRDQIRAGYQAYYVYPLVEESEKVDLKAAVSHAEYLQKEIFPEFRLGLLHGRLPADEKDRMMERFKKKEIDILVATTVIEVGIDISNATVMVVENAERFGLSQLHQLRGRVGRGSDQAYCILLAGHRRGKRQTGTPRFVVSSDTAGAQPGRFSGPVGRQLGFALDEQDQVLVAERRLATMAATTDGFRIAEVDLQLRGPGDFFGTRQSGIPMFRVANLLTDGDLLDQAREDAFDLLANDPALSKPDHRALAEHLAMLSREAHILLTTA